MAESYQWTPFHTQLHRTLLHRQLLPRNRRILVAVSGGQDSLCLSKLLIDLQSKWGWQLGIVHCDHRWRPDSQANADRVEDLAKSWQIPFYRQTAEEIPKTEAAARQWRYRVFSELAIAEPYDSVVTGHTASDRAETLLYNLVRGSGIEGLSALTWKRVLATRRAVKISEEFALAATETDLKNDDSSIYLVRPLLDFTREQTGQFCQEQKLPIWEDSTNQDLQYARNRIRLELIPYLQLNFNPQAEFVLAQTAELLRADAEYLQQAAEELRRQAMPPIGEDSTEGYRLPIQLNRLVLRQAPLALQRRVLRQVLQQVLPTAPTFDRVEKLQTLITAPNRSQTDPFPGGAIAYVEHPWIWIDRQS